MIRIRTARRSELHAIARLWMESWESTGLPGGPNHRFDLVRARLDRELAAGWSLYVATIADRIVGMLAIRPGDKHLDQLFVAPSFQGRGIGKALLAFARTQMPNEMWLRTPVENLRAIRWYEREGFRKEREELRPDHPLKRGYYRWRGK